MHRVELKAMNCDNILNPSWVFLMHRVELKGQGEGERRVKTEVPNAPCGVESLSATINSIRFSSS